MRSLQVFAYEN
ncbi:MAG: hypothetical protein D8M57_10810 [Candidatus Scalindua sp. AMX11]|nr:MAG: hypothetical protein DWQ00_19350 [Candidatus Scalindua sp.]RZV75887.1 MAG: hypothetical protein EX341_12585 [Candidatus Scalindua sp. SCAELEC01]TDE64946.1 MAG: hypothetical protein D8M57_10810 [Candidatus Scalindua sp. AMX11]